MAPDDSTSRNRLAEEKSPYLLQHADNPVDWRAWGEEAFRRAEEEDKPVFLSIGYSTCHWCHVMEEESFQDEELAELVNETVVPVKVDREERPEVDSLYMSVCQAMTGGGGWPLNLFLTPDKKPFFAGTYIPPESRGGRLGMRELLSRVARLWEEERERIEDSGDRVLQVLEGAERKRSGEGLIGAEALEDAFRQLERRYDEAHGGFGDGPKFPSPHNHLFLLRHWDRTGRGRGLEMVTGTLRAMRRGGIYDHVGYGFHRYATDARWRVPHFEKMLYDQALLSLAFVEAWQATGSDEFARTGREVLAYVLRDLRSPEGAFYSAEDADSEGGEGVFYQWTEEELRGVLSEEDFHLVRDVFDVREEGNFREEATGERTGRNILRRREPIDRLAGELGLDVGELESRLDRARERLFEVREERPRPHLDDKVLADWNGLAVAALSRAGAILGEERFVAAAREAAGFVLETLGGDPPPLLHRWRDGEAAVRATAPDYAFLEFGLLELHQATFEPRWLEAALALEREFRDRCWDDEEGGYFLAGGDVDELPVRQKEVRDGALPSSNSMALWNLRRLYRLTGRSELEERADRLEAAVGGQVEKSPAAHTHALVGVDFRVGDAREVVLAAGGGGPELEEMLRVLRGDYRPRTVAHLRRQEGEARAGSGPALEELAPFTGEQMAVDGKPTAYVCRDFACRAPTTDPEEMKRSLSGS